MGGKNLNVKHSLDFKRSNQTNGVASLKERLRQNANVKKWKGRREKHFGNNMGQKVSNFNSPETYLPINTRYGVKNNSFSKPKNDDQYMKNMRKVYHTIDYENGRNKAGQPKRKKFGSYNPSQSPSHSGSLTRSNKFLASNDFAFSTSQYRSNKEFDASLDIKGTGGHNRRASNNVISSGLSNLKRRKRQQDMGINGVHSFRNSFHNNNASLSTLYNKNSGMGSFWGVSSNLNNSLNSINKRSKEKIIPQNARQSLHLKLKKKIFQNSKKSIGENRREIHMLPTNTFNRKNFNEKYGLNMKNNNEGLLVKSYNNPIPGNASTSLDNYHTKSHEDVIKSSSSIMFKNMDNQRHKPINGQINHKILASLANKNMKDQLSNKKKPKKDLSADARIINAYSYDKGKKKDNSKVPTMGSTVDPENNSENMTQEQFQTEVKSYPQPHKQNSFVNKISDDLKHIDEKQYGSEGKINEYDDVPKEFDSPSQYKAISPTPNLNTSAMSKEVALEDGSFRIREDESKTNSKKFPMTSAKAILHYGKYLSEYEESEILNYSLVYYINKSISIDQRSGKKSKKNTQNFKVIKGEQLCYRYEIIESLGKGAFGEVIKCFDHKEKCDIAIKILKNSSDNYEQGMNEVNILRYVKENDPEDVKNIIKVNDTFIFRNQICIGFEIMDMNLYDVIKGRNFRGMKVKYIRRIALHILVGLCFLARQNVIHCDVKPENILLKKKDDQKGYIIKIIDFGSACFKDNIVYSYVQSRFYRAPEISLGIRTYSQAIDMWSFGAMLAELYTGIPLFPAESEEELLGLIMELRGPMPLYMVKEGMKGSKYFKDDGTPKEHVALMPRSKTQNSKDKHRLDLDEYAKMCAMKEGMSEQILNSSQKSSSEGSEEDSDEDESVALKHDLHLDSPSKHHYVVGAKTLDYVMQCEDSEFVDFIERCLDLDHKRRLTAKDALKHPWIIKGLK